MTAPAKRLRSRFAPSDLIGEALAAIARRPGRSLLTTLGTVVGVGAFVATTGLATTARAQVGESFDALKATEVRVVPADPDGTNPFADDVDKELGRLNGVNHAGVFWTIENDDLTVRPTAATMLNPPDVPVIAASPGAIAASRPTLATGRVYNAYHQHSSAPVAVLGRLAAEQLGVNRIDSQPAIFLDDTAYTVVGIIDDVQRNDGLLSAVIIPSTTATSIDTNQQTIFAVLIDVEPGAADLIGEQAPTQLRPDDPDLLRSLVPPDPRELREEVESDVTTLLYGLAGLALLVGMIGIANTTLVAVLERRGEIGVRRALGARRRHITAQFLTESATLGLAGGIIGTSLGIIVVVAIATSRDWTTTLEPLYLLPAPLIGAATGLIAGLQPARRAARITPAAALRTT